MVTFVRYISVLHSRVAGIAHFQSKCKRSNCRTDGQSDGYGVFLCKFQKALLFGANVLTATLTSFQHVIFHKHNFVATSIFLSRQTCVSRDKTFMGTNICRNKHTFVATNTCHKYFSRQTFCRYKIFLWRQAYMYFVATDTKLLSRLK